jgi:hypothetical protein
MVKESSSSNLNETIEVDLRQPGTAAFLAWLWPGAGHVYQGRYAKGALFMICILSTYFIGLTIGEGHVVYASWTKEDKRWQYICQVGVGLPALPALVQNRRVMADKEPLLGGIMAPPRQPVQPEGKDMLASWHESLSGNFDLGTLYTMIAGLLNVLAICDAYSGPFVPSSDKEKDEDSDKPPPKDGS